jgi:MFS family permease
MTYSLQVLSANDVGSLISPPIGGLVYGQIGRQGLLVITLVILVISIAMTVLMNEKPNSSQYVPVLGRNKKDIETLNDFDSLSEFDSDSDSGVTPLPPRDNFRYSNSQLNLDDEKIESKTLSITQKNWLIRKMPFLELFQQPAFLVAIGVSAIQAALLGAFDATIPLEARRLFHFGTTAGGMLFIPIGFVRLAAGPLGGWAVDRYGPKQVAVICYSGLVPVLLLFDVLTPHPESIQLVFYCVLLALCGAGMGGVATAGFVEGGNIVARFRSSGVECSRGGEPFALLYGINLMVFSFGMTLGSLMAGDFREWLGYGNMMAVLAGISCLGAFAAQIWMTER